MYSVFDTKTYRHDLFSQPMATPAGLGVFSYNRIF